MKQLVLALIMLLCLSCSAQNCNSINIEQNSYSQAITELRKTEFSISEKVDTDSSWIDHLEYYSCDEVTGYLVMTTKKEKSYIHKAVPVSLWQKFKATNSFGKFYNSNLKGKFQF